MRERDSNIELLRIVATLFILIVHCNGWFLRVWGGVGWNTGNTMVSACRILIQNVTLLGVDAFILISGFYGIRPKLKSIVNLFTLLLFFYVGCYLWKCGVGTENFTLICLFENMLAFSRVNWFVNSYLFLLLLSPLINSFVDSVDTKKIGMYTLLYCMITLYFGYYRDNQSWYYNQGYSTTMMIGVYMVGRYLYKIIDKLEKIKYRYFVFAFTGIIGLMSIIRVLSSNEGAWLHYGSPITMLAAVLLFLLFYRMPKFHSKAINWIASSCLASFILHTCDPVFSWLVRKDVNWFMNDVYFVYCLKIGVVIIGVFIFAIILDKIRLLIFSPVIKLSGRITQLN